MQNFATPMMKQYAEIKERYQDCLLLFRMGDFYELFLDDATIGAKVLNITLTSKPIGKDQRIPMAGVPYHAVDSYLSKLVKAGYKVAICEQLSPPNKYGLVERDVIRVVTPGTQLNEHALEKKENNYIVSLYFDNQKVSIAIADISTGFFAVTEKEYDDLAVTVKEEFAKIKPIECILSEPDYNNFELLKILRTETNLNIFLFNEFDQFAENAKKILLNQFEVSTLAGFSLEDNHLSQKAAAGLLGYLKETQKNSITHIKKIKSYSPDEYLVLDRSTMINLELFSTIREHDTKGSLLNVLDQTITAMGGRLLKEWLAKPLKDKEKIEERYDAVSELLNNPILKNEYLEALKKVADIERILSRISVGLGNGRDLINSKSTLTHVLEIKKKLTDHKASMLQDLEKQIDSKLQDLIILIENSIIEEPPIDTKIGGMIKTGVSNQLDELRTMVNNSKDWIKDLEKTERERTGISTLKVKFNKVFGFYIEVSKAQALNVPDNYLRKQTLVNGERFITKELKEKEELILSAQEKMCDLEFKLFTEICQKIIDKTAVIQQASLSIATFDCLLNFACLAEKNSYTRPKLVYSGELKIKNGRHPVVEKLLEDKQFVPNDLNLDNLHAQMLLITGPNMAGKSVFIRQVALIVLIAQIGCFIPADSAYITVVDRIFVRSGASDVITSGLSTFMVEMVETAYILNHATENSLIVMDEIGRGTSTYDGISIAWAIAEYLVKNYKKTPKTLFATHYHELQQLEEVHPKNIRNFSMAVAEDNGTPIFLYKVTEGAASHSFGVAVAKLAGVPSEVIKTAEQKLNILEKQPANQEIPTPKTSVIPRPPTPIVNDQIIFEHLLYKDLENVDIANMTPLDALNKLADLKEKSKIIKEESITPTFLKAD